MRNGQVVSIHIVRVEAQPAEAYSDVKVLPDFGIEGDYRSGQSPHRQVTLVEEEVLADVGSALGIEVSPGASRRQIMVRGIRLNALLDKTIHIGQVTVRGESLCDPCDNMERTIGRGARRLLEGRGGLCCRVLEGGTLSVGDTVTTSGEDASNRD